MKRARVTVSLIIFFLINFYFLDFANLLPNEFHVLAHAQLIPALVAVNVIAVLIIALLTILFGRIYCSSICPLGILQDIVAWFSKKIHHKKKYPAFKEQPFLRWAIVLIAVVAFWAGSSIVLSLLDPYSAYGRVSTTIFRPLYLSGNNLVAWIDNQFSDYRFYKTDIFISGIATLFVAVLTLGVVGFLSFKYGRLFCNTICPVGTILGFVSRFSFFKIKIDNEQCNSCSLCSMKCKSSCIDPVKKTIDYSRCVTCFNCLGVCNRKAMSYSYAGIEGTVGSDAGPGSADASRRKLLSAFVVLTIAGIQHIFARKPDSTRRLREMFGRKPDSTKQPHEIYGSHNVAYFRTHPITPPGSVNVKNFNTHCTACNLCVSKCPSNVLKPSFLEYGIIGMLQPMMDFQHGYCNYHCTVCAEICPSKALQKITAKDKRTLQVGHVDYIKENCIVVTDGTDCGACSEHCPTQAVSMQPYKRGLRIPVIDQNLCVGCGACEYICPTRPFRAIYVVGNPVHKQAKIPEEKEEKKVEVNDFGF